MLPVSRFVRAVPFRAPPSLFYLVPTDGAFRAAAWLGVALACLALTGVAEVQATTAAATAPIWDGLPSDDVAAATRVLNDVLVRAHAALAR